MVLADLTTAQRDAIRADILAQPDLAGQQDSQIAALYNAPAFPTFHVYRTSVPVQDVYDQIVWANLTPVDAVPTTAGSFASVEEAVSVWQARSLAAQGKQFNLQTILIGAVGSINAAKSNVRAGLQDALTGLPTGASGSVTAAGWVNVRDFALARPALRIEKLLATTTAQQDGSTAAKAATVRAEGAISAQTISDLLAGQ